MKACLTSGNKTWAKLSALKYYKTVVKGIKYSSSLPLSFFSSIFIIRCNISFSQAFFNNN